MESRYVYDALGRLISRVDAEGNEQTYAYDGRGRNTLIDDPDLGRHEMEYDATGNLLAHIHPDGEKNEYTYDLADRILTENWDGKGTPEVVYHYDEGAGKLGLGKLLRIDEPSGFVEHTYDARSRVTSTIYQIEGQEYEVTSGYDAQDREIVHGYPDGSRIAIHRNSRGQLSSFGEDALTIEYGENGLEVLRRFNTGVEMTSVNDLDARRREFHVTAADGTVLEDLKWDYDHAGNLVSLKDRRRDVSPAQDRSESYAYDNLYRLTGVTGAWGTTEWKYSATGNLLSRESTVDEQNAKEFEYGKRPHAVTEIDGRKFKYDVRGRMEADGTRTYRFDGVDQLTRVEQDGAYSESVYGLDGVRRVRRERARDGKEKTTHFIDGWSEVRDGKLVRYIVHGGQRIVRLAEETGQVAAVPPRTNSEQNDKLWVLWLVALLFASLVVGAGLKHVIDSVIGSTRRRFALPGLALAGAFLVLGGCGGKDGSGGSEVTTLISADTIIVSDLIGSMMGEADGLGNRQSTVALYPFGHTRFDDSAETNKFAGTPRDAAVALDHMGARFYAPDLGVWTSGDPIAITEPSTYVTAEFAAANPYAYANLQPVIAADRNGQFWHIAAGALAGAVIGGGIEAYRQYATDGEIKNWGKVGAAAGGGAVAGAITTANPAAGYATVMSYGAASGAAGGLTERLINSGGKDAGTVTEVVVDAAISGVTAGVVKGGASLLSKLKAKPAVAPPAPKPPTPKPAAQGAVCPCFAANTLVATPAGYESIEDIKIGDLVLSKDEVTGEFAFKRVTNLFITPGKELLELHFERSDNQFGDTPTVEVILATPGHPFWVEGVGWRNAGELPIGSLVATAQPSSLLSAEGSLARLSVALSLEDTETVYNLEVEEFHTYFVGEGRHWVHNACGCEGAGAPGGGRQDCVSWGKPDPR